MASSWWCGRGVRDAIKAYKGEKSNYKRTDPHLPLPLVHHVTSSKPSTYIKDECYSFFNVCINETVFHQRILKA